MWSALPRSADVMETCRHFAFGSAANDTLDESSTHRSFSRPNNFSPSQVPANRHGKPTRKSLIVSGVSVPLTPSQSALISKIETATGQKTVRCTSLGQPSSISQCAIAISLDDCSRLTSIRSITTMIAPIRAHPDSNKRPAVKVPVKSFR